VVWKVIAHLPLRDGRISAFPLSGNVIASTRGTSANANPADLGRRYLHDGVELAQLGAEYNIDGSGISNSHLIHQLKTYLATPHPVTGLSVVSPDRRRALLDAPIAARRTVYALLNNTTHELTAEGYDAAFIELIHSTYIDNIGAWRESWTSGAFILQRRLLHLILKQPDPANGIAITTAASKLGVPYDSLVALASTRNSIPPAVSRNWKQRTAIGRADRLLIPKACPWSDCLGNLPQRQHSGTPASLATHYLHVPELPEGLLCPQCRRVPDQTQPFAAARFPNDYLQPYRRRTNKEDGTRIGTRIETASWAAVTSA